MEIFLVLAVAIYVEYRLRKQPPVETPKSETPKVETERSLWSRLYGKD